MKQKLTPEIFAYFGTRRFPDETSSNKEVQAFFERFYQAGHGMLTEYNVHSIPDPQTNYTPPAPQFAHVQSSSSTLNMCDAYDLPPSSSQPYRRPSQTYCVPSQTCWMPSQTYYTPSRADSVPSQTSWEQSADLSADAPMNSGQGNSATAQDPSQSPDLRAMELMSGMVLPTGEWYFDWDLSQRSM